MNISAHISSDGREQSVAEHCRNTAEYASSSLSEVGLAEAAYLAGLLHDAGKSRTLFSDYLRKAAEDPSSVRRGSVNHTFAGVRYTLEHWHRNEELNYPELAAELIAYTCGAHHGHFDCVNDRHESGFERRVSDNSIGYEEVLQNYRTHTADDGMLEDRFSRAVEELTPVLKRLFVLPPLERGEENADAEFHFYLGLLARLLLSAVIDGDRRDTAEFMNKTVFPVFPHGTARKEMWRSFLNYMENELDSLPTETDIQKARRAISDKCARFAHKEGKIIRLNVPTGGGKTLSSLRFALTYAAEHNSTRIILTSSLLSVLDQNAEEVRKRLPRQEYITEHHSNVVKPKEEEELRQWELMTQRWSSPVIITTLVQLLNTLFSGKSDCVRRFQALCGSVIIIDEVQTVPGNLLTLFNLAMNFLSEVCGATVVLCSATQPCFEKAQHPLLREPENMVPFEKGLWDIFRRTEIVDLKKALTFAEIPEKIAELSAVHESILIVCNTKKEASELFSRLSDLCDLENSALFHLSASMCMAHRRDVLAEIKSALARKEKKVICVSTQVIEAGVDISFQCVVRFIAGMDSIVQSAGRCNRNRENPDLAPVYVLRCADEDLRRLPDIRRSRDAALSLLDFYEKDPGALDNDLTSDRSIAFYYRSLYRQMDDQYQDDVITLANGQRCSVFDLLGRNDAFTNEDTAGYLMRQAFKTAGDAFAVFDSDTWDVIVPYESPKTGKKEGKENNSSGQKIINELIALSHEYKPNYQDISEQIEQASTFTVSIYSYQKEKLERMGALTELFGGRVAVLSNGFYNMKTGITTSANEYWEVSD